MTIPIETKLKAVFNYGMNKSLRKTAKRLTGVRIIRIIKVGYTRSHLKWDIKNTRALSWRLGNIVTI
jgi:hypothetical protein